MSYKMPKKQGLTKDKIELDAFRTYMNNSPDIALLSRIDNFQFVAVNDLACKEYGYTRKQFLALQIFDLEVTPQLEEEVKVFYDRTRIGKVMTYQGINKRKDGSQFPVEVRFSKISSTYGLAHIRNTSERVRSIERDRFLAQMSEDASVAMLGLDLKFNLTHWSKGCESLLGYSRKEVLSEQIINLVLSKERPKINRFLVQLVKEREFRSRDTVLIHKSGKQIVVNATYWITKDENGVVNGLAGLIRDNSKEKMAKRMQDALLNIAQASSRRIIDTKWFSKFVFKELGTIMNVDNFYIILYDKVSKSYKYPIVRGCKGLKKALQSDIKKRSLASRVMHTGKPVFEQKSELLKHIKIHKIQMETEVPEVYLGVPLKSEGKVVGVLAVQSFKDPFAYSIRNMIALELVSNLISNILTRDLIIDELMTSEEHYRSLSEKSADVISVLDKHWVIQYESLPSKHVFGRNAYEMLGHSFLDYIHPEYKGAIKKCLTAVSKIKDKNATVKCRYLHGNGSWIWAELSIKNLLSDPVVKGILIHKKNITKSHETEELLKSSEAKFKSLFTKSLEAIYLVDPLTRMVIDANQSFLDYTGFSQEDYGTIALEDFVVTSVSNINGYINKVLEGTDVENIERIWKRKSGEEITVLVSGSKIKIDHKEIVVVAARNITPQKKTEKELLKINQELDTFVYKASHDLRGPLTTCLGLVNMSQDEVKDEKAVWYLDMIKEVLGKLDGILTDLTQITSIRQGNVEYVNIHLAKMVQAAVKEFKGHPDVRNLTFKPQIKIKRKISSDAAILRMVFRNLIGNAIKYQKENGKNPFLQISASEDEEATLIVFEDNGIGIDDSVGNSIFDMFIRGTSESKGSGLGLYMVRTGLDKINGSITVESKLGKGSRFTITIPNLYC